MHRNPLGYDKAYNKLVDYLLQFSMSRVRSGELDKPYPATHGGLEGFGYEFDDVQIDDLVLVSAMQVPDFRLSWVLQTRNAGGGNEYLLRSAKTGEEIWWSNVGLAVFHRATRIKHADWRWTNEQVNFSDRWFQAASDCDEYMVRPMMPEFGAGTDELVTIKTRARHNFTDYKAQRTFAWKLVNDQDLRDYYRSMEQEHKDKKP